MSDSTALTTVADGEVATTQQQEVVSAENNAQTLRETPAHVPPLPAQEVDAVFAQMAWWDQERDNNRAEALRQKWGSDAGVNLQFARAFALAHSDVTDLLDRDGLGDHPTIVEVAARLGRRYAEVSGKPAGMTKGRKAAPMSEADQIAFAGNMEELRGQINAAQSRGQTKLANLLYAEEQRRLAARVGSQPIVGGGGRTA